MPKRPATFLRPGERDALLAAVADPRDRAILTLYCFAGLRRNELRMLDRADVDFRERSVTVRFAKRGKQRVVPLHPRVVEALTEYLATRGDDHPALFVSGRGGRLALKTLWHVLDRATAGVDLGKPVRLHSLRHTCLTNVYRATKDLTVVQRLAGHSDIRTTTIYLHMDDDEARRAIDAQ